MVNVIGECAQVRVPGWVTDLSSFRRWADTDDCPEQARVHFLEGEVWVDVSREEVFTHIGVKTELVAVLTACAKPERSGLFLGSGVLLSNDAAGFAVKPDGLFISKQTQASGRVRWLHGPKGDCDEIEGTPDLVVEVVSRSSVHKDTVVLKKAYREAGIPEYWLIDARKAPLVFDVFRHTARGYVATRKQDGWVKSAVFGKSFRLTRQDGKYPDFTLESR